MANVLCLAHDFRGTALLWEARCRGCRIILLTRERFREAAWPWEAIDEFYTLESLDQALPLVCDLMRERRIDHIFPLQERDVERAAALREFFCLPGMTPEVASRFRDKLAMRELTSQAGVPNPAFVHVLHHPTIERYCRQVEAPWMLKPRSEAGSLGIVRVDRAEELWTAVEAMGDEASYYLLEQRVRGDVYHVDSVVHDGRVCFSQAHRYGNPPFEVWNHGGVFSTATLAEDDPVRGKLAALNAKVLDALGLERGVAHVEFVGEPGGLVFLEAAARVGGANIDVLVEKASGVSLWEEWLKLELLDQEYRPPERRFDSAILLQCLARDERPDLSYFDAPETVWKLEMPRHAGVIVASADPVVVRERARRFHKRLESAFMAVAPPLKRAR